MLDLAFIQENPETLREMLQVRGLEFDLAALLEADRERRSLIQAVEGLRGQRKEQSKQLGILKQAGQDISSHSAGVRKLGEELEAKEKRLVEVQARVDELLLYLPNLPQASVPRGKGAQDNPVLRTWGEKPQFSFPPLDHAKLGEELGILDFERGAKISGARFTLSWGIGARLERALINFMIELHTLKHGYQEVLPPFLVNARALIGTGNLPKFKDDLFHIASHDLYLIPTAEVPVTNIHQDEILDEAELPKAYVAYTPCFRSEAGSYGKDTKGLIRQHQFNKVEIVRFVSPAKSSGEHELLTGHAEKVLQELELPYRVVELCTGDLGFSSTKTYDLEVWLPGQKAYREISSCSNFGDFQARRAKIRFKSSGGKPQWVHTLNGSGLAVGRTLVAILENFQQKDGSVIIPKVLRPYLGGLERISK